MAQGAQRAAGAGGDAEEPLLPPSDLVATQERRVTFSDNHIVIDHTGAPSSEEGAGDAGCCSCYSSFKASVRALKHEVLALHYAVQDPRTPWASKLIPLVALAYALSPLDLIPDFIPLLGLVDDLLLVPTLIWVALLLIPRQVMADARRRAAVEPLLLHRNWLVAVLVAGIWTAGAVALVHLGVQRYGDPDLLEYEWAALAGTAGVATILFVTWSVSRLRYERRRRDEWNTTLLAAPNLGAGGDGLAGEV